MLDIPPPPTNVPGKSSLKRFLNWARPSLDIPVEQLRPDKSYVQHILGAACDIRICEKIFDNWTTQLDRVSSSSGNGKPDERELVLRRYLASLKVDAGWCSRVTNAILLRHAQFACLMARRVDGASKSWRKRLQYEVDTARLANDVVAFSRSLQQHVARMRTDLAAFVGALEQMERKVEKKKKRVISKIWGWLKHLFNALAKICDLGAFVLPFVPFVPPGMDFIASAGSTLMRTTAALCGAAKKMHERKESENIKSVLQYLKVTVPKEAQEAQKRLAKFDEALVVMNLEAHMKTGRRVALLGPNLPAIAQEWSDVAKLYQSMLPADKNPGGAP